jgi:hypothetical protein
VVTEPGQVSVQEAVPVQPVIVQELAASSQVSLHVSEFEQATTQVAPFLQ